MSKVKLSKAELAALDALIASFDNEKIQSSPENLTFITAVARVTVAATRVAVRATPYVAEATAAVLGDSADSTDLSKLINTEGELNLDALIKLREEANK